MTTSAQPVKISSSGHQEPVRWYGWHLPLPHCNGIIGILVLMVGTLLLLLLLPRKKTCTWCGGGWGITIGNSALSSCIPIHGFAVNNMFVTIVLFSISGWLILSIAGIATTTIVLASAMTTTSLTSTAMATIPILLLIFMLFSEFCMVGLDNFFIVGLGALLVAMTVLLQLKQGL